MVLGLYLEQAEAIFKNFSVEELLKLDDRFSFLTLLEITKNKQTKITEQKTSRVGQGNLFTGMRQGRGRN